MRPVLLIPAFGLLLVVAVWAVALIQLAVDRQGILDRALQDTEIAATALEQHTLRVLKDADRSAMRVKYEFEATGKVDLRAMLASNLMSADEIDQVNIANAAGEFVASTHALQPLNVADRAYFKRHLARDTGKLDISEPVISRLTGLPTIVLSRRLNAADGSFAGIVTMSVRPSYFTNFFVESQLGKNGGVTVLGLDGIFRAWKLGTRAVTTLDGIDGRATRVFTMAAADPTGSFRGKSAIDGDERMVVYRTLRNYPLIVTTAQATDDVLADFYHQRAVFFGIATIASALIVGFFAIVTLLVVRLRRSGDAIEAQQSFLLTLVDNIPFGVCVRNARGANRGKILLWNSASELILGVPRDEAVGKTFGEFLPPMHAARVEVSDREMLTSPMVQDFTEHIDVTPKHAQKFLRIIRAPIFDADNEVEHIISVTSDITQEYERASSARLAAKVFETTSDGIMMSDADDRVVNVNAAFSRLTGYDADEIVGKVLADSPFRPLDVVESVAMMDQLRRDGFVTGEVPRFRKDGTPLSLWKSASCVRNADGAICNYIRIFTDISPLKSSQRDLEKLADSLRDANAKLTDDVVERTRAAAALHQANEELLQANIMLHEAQDQVLQSEKLASIGQLAAGVAHEINNPIGYVLSNFGTLEGYVQGLFEMLAAYEDPASTSPGEVRAVELAAIREKVELDYLKDEIPTLMKESKEGISRVRKIVEDLKDFSRTDSNQDWVWADLHRGIDSTLNIVGSEIKYKAEVVKEYGELPNIECLPTQLNQVFMNLLVNAAQAINKSRGRIVIRSGTEGDHVWVEVADDGGGMPPEVKSRVFDPFFTTKPVGKGTGLGLSLTYGIIKKHHGRIDLETEVGKGTTFRVWLPIRHVGEGGKAQTQPAFAEPVGVLATA